MLTIISIFTFLLSHHKIDPTYNAVLDIRYISPHTIDKIKYFFQHYKDLENKQVKIGEVHSNADAVAVYLNSVINYEVNSTSVKNKVNSYFDKL